MKTAINYFHQLAYNDSDSLINNSKKLSERKANGMDGDLQ